MLIYFCIIITNVYKTSKKIFSRVLCETENKMANFQSIKNICKKLGENNKPTYVVMSIAAVKGISRVDGRETARPDRSLVVLRKEARRS